ncbi:hypothetical protein [Ruminococcus albus]|uniref:hypothetical protein n=1 Tax=Ruminococcus albus TaxID=1264 RepID=UPI00046402AD|nr:hypothetical protein [Ruminococcus albus]
MAEKKLSGIIIPMTVLAYRVQNGSKNVPALAPSYKEAYHADLGKDVSPQAFNANVELQEGLHLHFVLPSAFKHGTEKTNDDGSRTFEYPLVPDRYIVTRMYTDKKTGMIVNDCNIVESNFCSMESGDIKSITIPFYGQDDTLEYRYLGRQYTGFEEPPAINADDGYISDLCGVGAGDPVFNAYYPSCRSVFGYYDDLDGVPSDAVLTYSVIGYYSDAENDPFSAVRNEKEMKDLLEAMQLKAEDESICNSCLLFGEVCKVDLSEKAPLPENEINAGIGKTSAEALSAVISSKYTEKDLERILTMIQYDMVDERDQIDGNFKVDDTIHSYGFNAADPIETAFEIVFDKDAELEDTPDVLAEYSELALMKHRFGKSRRLLEYKKNELYYLWEMYKKNSTSEVITGRINTAVDEINKLRNEIIQYKRDLDAKLFTFQSKIDNDKVRIEDVPTKPFYSPKDPALMLFGKGISRTYAFGEDGRFEDDNTLYCLTSPLSCDDTEHIKELISSKVFNSVIDTESYLGLLVMTVLLDNDSDPAGTCGGRKYSQVMVNREPYEEVSLFMEWESVFFNDYTDSTPSKSAFDYENTDYTYDGEKTQNYRLCMGTSVLTPYGVCNLENKLKKYIDDNFDAKDKDDIKDILDKIHDIPALSQSLGGFTINMAALKYVFQLPMDTTDDLTKKVHDCLYMKNPEYYEPDPERRAVIDDTDVVPLREGFLDLRKLSIVSTFGNRRKIIEDDKLVSGTEYISENLYPVVDDCCFLPLALTTPARLSPRFVSAINEAYPSCTLPISSPIIGIITPDILNRNLNIFDNEGDLIGIIKRVYRNKKVEGRFREAAGYTKPIDRRITDFIKMVAPDNKDSSCFIELVDLIEKKLDDTIPMYQSDFIFGRVLVLADMDIVLEYYGGTEYSKNSGGPDANDDKGLMEQGFPVMIGDIERVSDGVVCGFYDGFGKAFAPFGYDTSNNKVINAAYPTVSGEKNAKVTLLLDPSLKVTVSTGFLPVEQVQINASHTDLTGMDLMSAEMDMLVSEKDHIQTPDFTKGEKFVRKYPVLENDTSGYKELEVVKAVPAIGTVEKTIITDGLIVKRAAAAENKQ